MDKKFAGPYKVVAKTVKGNCQLEDMKGKVLKTWVPVHQRKKYLKHGDVGLESETNDESDVDQDKLNFRYQGAKAFPGFIHEVFWEIQT